MNDEFKAYIDNIIIPSYILTQRIKTGEYVRELCDKIPIAIKNVFGCEVYEYPNDVCDNPDTIFFANLIKNTPTSKGYFLTVSLNMEYDFEDLIEVNTSIEITFTEEDECIGDFDMDDYPEKIVIHITPDGYTVTFNPISDVNFPTITNDMERIKTLIDILQK